MVLLARLLPLGVGGGCQMGRQALLSSARGVSLVGLSGCEPHMGKVD